MKFKNALLTSILCLSFAFLIGTGLRAAETNTLPPPAPPPATDYAKADLPTSNEALWTWGIGAVTPVIVWLFGKIPQLPRPVLPVLTPFIGLAIGWTLKKLGGLQLEPYQMAAAGSLGVFIRECTNQLVTKQFRPLEESKTAAKPIDKAVAVKDPSK